MSNQGGANMVEMMLHGGGNIPGLMLPRIMFGVIWFLVWLACIIWVAMDAGQRRISPIFWPLATVVSGPLGLLAYGVVRELVSKKESS
jgi:hypothetical protein